MQNRSQVYMTWCSHADVRQTGILIYISVRLTCGILKWEQKPYFALSAFYNVVDIPNVNCFHQCMYDIYCHDMDVKWMIFLYFFL